MTFSLTGWELDSEGAWSKITGRKCVICHLKDPVITVEASLFKAIHGKDQQTTFLVLEDDCQDPHSRLLTDLEFDQVVQAIGFRNLLKEAPLELPVINPEHSAAWLKEEEGLFGFFQRKMSGLFTALSSFVHLLFRCITLR